MIAPRPSIRRRLQKRTDRLREEVDASVRAERQQAIRSLLRHPLLLPEGKTAAHFSRVRRHAAYLAEWFAHNAAWTLSVNAEVIRLRKTPADVEDASRPAADPKSLEPFNRRRYALLCIALSVLERGDRQITLGKLVEQMSGILAAEPVFAEHGVALEPERQSSRRDLVLVLRLLLELGALRRVQGDEDGFVRDQSNDALYNIERSVLAALPSGARSPSLLPDDAPTPHATLTEEPTPGSREGRNRAIRVHLIRRLLDDPILYYADLSEDAMAYLESQRSFLLKMLEDATGLIPEVRAEGIALGDLSGDTSDIGLPEEGTDGHLTLLLATWMADHLRKSGAEAPISRQAATAKTRELLRTHARHWRKDASEPEAEKRFLPTVLERLAGLALVRIEGDTILPLPAIGRYALAEEASSQSAQPAAQADLF